MKTLRLKRKHIYIFALWAFLLIAIQGCSSHANYPVTRLAGWAPEAHVKWQTLNLSAKFKDQDFSQFNSTTDLLIRAKVTVQGRGTVTYKLNTLHISQRTIQEDLQKIIDIKITAPGNPPKANDLFIKQYQKEQHTDTISFTLIEITPVFAINPLVTTAETREFNLEIEEPIQNRTWGRNYYRVQLGDRHIDLGTFQ